jgi:cytochrome c peroxidase
MSRSALSTSLALLTVVLVAAPLAAQELTPLEQVGKFLFFDTNLSTPFGQSCAACHAPAVGFTGPISEINGHGAVYPGAVHTRFGNRKPPAASYGGNSPILHYDADEGVWVGGMFWDGRATGWTLGDPLAEQAQGPFLNPLEQNNPNAHSVVSKVARSAYANLFRQVWGPDSLPPPAGKVSPLVATVSAVAEGGGPPFDVALAYERIARSIAAYERSAEVNPYSSKYDYWLAGMATLTEHEEWGRQLFNDPLKGNCAACHISEPGPMGEPPQFTDFTYDNLGVPRNLENPFYGMPPKWNPDGAAWTDYGLGGFLLGAGYPPEVYEPELGKQKVPTLRNVDLRPSPDFVKAFGHNGFFKSLEEITHFYNTRDVEMWPPPEIPETVNTDELGNLGLTAEEEAAIVAFMRTLNDGYVP